MRRGRPSTTMCSTSLQGRLAAFPLVLFSSYTLLQAYEGYFENSDHQDMDVVELWSGVESVVFAARAAGHGGHQPLRAEGFDKHRSPGITDHEGPGCEDITCVDGFRHALQLIYRLRTGGLLWMAPTCSSFSFANSCRCKRKAGHEQGDTSYKNVAVGNLEAQVAAFLFALATALGIYAVIENPIASFLFSYIQPFLVSQVPVCYTNTYRCAWDMDTPTGQRMLKGYKFLAAAGNAWVQQLQRSCSCPGGIKKGNHIPLMNETEDGKSSGNRPVMQQSQAYPRELGKAIVSAWLTARERPPREVLQVTQGGPAGLEATQGGPAGHEATQGDSQLHDKEFDTAWEGSGEAPAGHTVNVTTSDFDSAWGASSISASHTPDWEGWD